MSSWNDLPIKDKADIMKVAVRNGITKLSDIRDKYNELALGGDLEDENLYDGGGNIWQRIRGNRKSQSATSNRTASGGSWISQHQNRWYNYLLNHGVGEQDAQRLSGFFAAQDALESAGGTSSAARTKNNFGGMQKGGKNIYYASPEAYMDAKWRMMNRTFRDALGAKTIDEYATLLGDPSRVGRGRSLYYVTDKVALDAKSPVWQAAQTKHMHDYINGMRAWAGKGRINYNDPQINAASHVDAASYVPEIPEGYVFPDEMQAFQNFQPSNPQAFFNGPEYYENLRALYTPEEGPITKAAEEYSQAELARAEKQQGINNFFTIMNLMNQGSSSSNSQPENSFLAPIASLVGNSQESNALGIMGSVLT